MDKSVRLQKTVSILTSSGSCSLNSSPLPVQATHRAPSASSDTRNCQSCNAPRRPPPEHIDDVFISSSSADGQRPVFVKEALAYNIMLTRRSSFLSLDLMLSCVV